MNVVWQKIKTVWLKTKKWREERKWFLIAVGILYFLFAAIFLALWGRKSQIAGATVYWNLVWLALVVGYTLASITGTGKSERASKFLFGRRPVGAEIPPQTLTFVPFGLFTLETLPVEVQELELPGESEQIWSGQAGKGEERRELILGVKEDGDPAPLPKKRVGKDKLVELPWVQPIRATLDDLNPFETQDPLYEISGPDTEKDKGKLPDMPKFRKAPITALESGKEPEEEEPEDPATKRVTVEIRGTLLWRPRVLSNFWRSLETFENAENVLRKIAISEMTSAVQVGNLARMLANQELLGLYIAKKIRERVDHYVVYTTEDGKHYSHHPKGKTPEPPEPTDPDHCRRGVEIIGFLLRPPDLSHDLNIKMQGILEAKAAAGAARRVAEGTKLAAQLEGEGEKLRNESKAEGERALERGKIIGRQEGYKALKRIGMTPSEILAADTGRQIAENVGNLNITDDKVLAAVGAALAAGRGFLASGPSHRLPKKRRVKTDAASGTPSTPPSSSPPPPTS